MIEAVERLRETGREWIPAILSRAQVRDDLEAGEVIRGALAGALGGTVAAYVMSKAWVAAERLLSGEPKTGEEPKEKRGERSSGPHEKETATARAAEHTAHGFLG